MCLRRFSILLLFVALVFPCSGEGVRVSLIPKDVYVGDEAEIRFEFSFAGNLFEKSGKQGSSGSCSLSLSASSLSFADEDLRQIFFSEEYTIREMQLKGGVHSYILSVSFIPWKNGSIDISAFDLASIFAIPVRPLFVDIPPVHIQSIVEKTGEKQLRPVKGPIIVPGTTYIVAAFSAAVLFCIAVLATLLIRFTLIRTFMLSFFKHIFSSHNFRKILRELLFLEKNSRKVRSDIFCTRLSSLVRNYLENRFSHPFTAKTSSELVSAFLGFSAHSASSKAYEYMHSLYEVCVRCDYIRFSEAGKHEDDVFSLQERISIVAKVRSALLYFEQPEEPDTQETV